MGKKGVKFTEVHKLNLSLSHKGKKLGSPSEETKKKMSIAHMGNKSNMGRKLSTEHRLNISKSMRNIREKLYSWKGGITPINAKIRNSLESKLWRKSVFERDNFICQKYGMTGGKLVAHHINNFADFPEVRTSIDNGITLSDKAHREFHKKYGKKNNTQEQIIEFLK